jgi:hypothetical protein
MNRVLTAELAEFLELELVGGLLLILRGGIILPFTFGAIETDDNAHCTTPKLTS